MRYFPLLLVILSPIAAAAQNIPIVVANDNSTGAGTLANGELTIRLVVKKAVWYPENEGGPSKVIDAFAEFNGAPRVPAPLMRMPLGTAIRATITNELADTVALLGLGDSRSDTLWIPPGSTLDVRHRPAAAGTFMYAAGARSEGVVRFGGTTGQLVGGLIVDDGPAQPDRILIATAWDPVPIAGQGHFLAMNGKSWPFTEKFDHTVGDTVRWRVLNGVEGGSADHPMHLHGFYYRVDARGGWDADTSYADAARRWVVTENLPGLSSMSMTWIPQRPGNWLFHCHNSDHVAGTNRHTIADRARPFPALPMHDAQEHLAADMSGIANAITIHPRADDAPAPVTTTTARRLRLLVQSRPQYFGAQPGFGYVLQEGGAPPAADSVMIPGPQLVLKRDERVEITVINRMNTHTAVHWHGIELDSYYDGVAGWSGMGDRLAPMIAPGDSFVVRFTPPRAGTFIYHAHMTDHVQLARGLYGALIVEAPDKPIVRGADHVALVSFGRPGGRATIMVNGSITPAPVARNARGVQRLRVINIATENDVVLTLSADATPVRWTMVAKDGFDVPPAQRVQRPATVQVFPGETYDFEFESDAPLLQLLVKNPDLGPGLGEVRVEIRVREP